MTANAVCCAVLFVQEALFPLLNVPEKEKDRAKPFTISADRMTVGLKGTCVDAFLLVQVLKAVAYGCICLLSRSGIADLQLQAARHQAALCHGRAPCGIRGCSKHIHAASMCMAYGGCGVGQASLNDH
jgi:hypothetical protein